MRTSVEDGWREFIRRWSLRRQSRSLATVGLMGSGEACSAYEARGPTI